jgi:hypothetical protein
MRRSRYLLALACSSFVMLGLACVDLFHGTDFDTLCTRTPTDPACVTADGAVTPDVVEASVDAAAAHPDFCAWDSAQAQAQAKRACAWLGACEGTVGESVFGACTIDAQLAYDCSLTPTLRPRGSMDAFWACLATVKSCGDVDRCVFPGGVQECVTVASGSASACGKLDTSVRVECAGPQGRARGVEPCAMVGKQCTPDDTSSAICAGKLAFACTKNACSGTSRVDCTAAGARMLDRGYDCANVGAGNCVESDAGPYCAPGSGTTACDGGQALPSCDGNSKVDSCIDGVHTRIDCSKLGLGCDVSQLKSIDPTSACVNRGAGSCTPGTDTCESPTLLRSCGRGQIYEVDCASVGLGTCAVNVAGHGACGKPAN